MFFFEVPEPEYNRECNGSTTFHCEYPLYPELWCRFEFAGSYPDKLYRYMARSHADELLRLGRMRLGNLYGYRVGEGLNPARVDDREGLGTVHVSVGEEHQAHYITSLDVWMICLSENISADLPSEFDVDAVLELETYPFMLSLAGAMVNRSSVASLRKVTYFEIGMPIADDMSRSHTLVRAYKSSEYENQKEYRVCFERRGDAEQHERDNLFRQCLGNHGGVSEAQAQRFIDHWLRRYVGLGRVDKNCPSFSLGWVMDR